MEVAPTPADEAERLEVLEALRVLDTPPEPFFDDIAELARTLAGVKSAMVAMIDGDRKWLKACSGGSLDASPREIAFCAHAILQDDVMWVEDARQDARFQAHPLVTGPKGLKFYAGAPIIVSGFKVGTLCLNDETPRAYDAGIANALKRLAAMVARQLATRRMGLMSDSVLAASGDAIVCADSRRKIVFWNGAAEQLFGYGPAEALGQDLSLIAHTDCNETLIAPWTQTLDGEDARPERTFEASGRCKDGTCVPLEITWADWSDGDYAGVSLIIRDCSERRRTSEALRDALGRAEAANVAKTEFLAVMSHEIRTPLNGVLGMAQAMQAAELSDSQRERLRVLRRSGQVLLTLLDGLLDLAKIEAGRLELEYADFDLEHLVRGAVTPFAALAAQKGITFHFSVDPSAATIFYGDAVRVRQILSNLTANAVKFTANGEVRVEVSYDHCAVLLRVQDTGVGVAPEKIPTLFDKFVQADASTTRRFGGSGLGLAICRELVELMSGSIEISSEEGLGSTFSVSLPLAIAQLGTSRLEKSPVIEENVLEPRAMRVLAAEDNSINQVVLRALLDPIGVELTVVDNGVLALEAWEREDWDLILMDVQMPELDGPGAARRIREREWSSSRPRTPIIAVTANGMETQKAEYRAAGMDGIVVKPIDAGQLFSAIEQVLSEADDERRLQRAATGS